MSAFEKTQAIQESEASDDQAINIDDLEYNATNQSANDQVSHQYQYDDYFDEDYDESRSRNRREVNLSQSLLKPTHSFLSSQRELEEFLRMKSGLDREPPKDMPPLSDSLLKPTQAFLSMQRELEDSKSRIKPENDIWWSQRGGKLSQVNGKVINKSLTHVTSKLFSPTAATTFGSREKVVAVDHAQVKINSRKPTSPSSPIHHQHANVKSRLMEPTKAAINSEWNRRNQAMESDNLSTMSVNSQSDGVLKVKETSARLLVNPAHNLAHKYKRENDPREKGWKTHIPPKGVLDAPISPLRSSRRSSVPSSASPTHRVTASEPSSLVSPADDGAGEGASASGTRKNEVNATSHRRRSAPTSGPVIRPRTDTESPSTLLRASSSSSPSRTRVASTANTAPITPFGFGSSKPRAVSPAVTSSNRKKSTNSATPKSRDQQASITPAGETIDFGVEGDPALHLNDEFRAAIDELDSEYFA